MNAQTKGLIMKIAVFKIEYAPLTGYPMQSFNAT